jgi:hypothetical protein
MRRCMAKRLAPYVESVFEEFHALAHRHNAVDLGSGTLIYPCRSQSNPQSRRRLPRDGINTLPCMEKWHCGRQSRRIRLISTGKK